MNLTIKKDPLIYVIAFCLFTLYSKANTPVMPKPKVGIENTMAVFRGYDLNDVQKRGISITIQRTGKAERLEDLKDIDAMMMKTNDTRLEIGELGGQLEMVLTNVTEPYSNPNAIPYLMFWGHRVEKNVNAGIIGGFIPSSEVKKIVTWIKENKADTYEGFFKLYNELSPEVKNGLAEWHTPEKERLFEGVFKPLAILYFTALENGDSVVFMGS